MLSLFQNTMSLLRKITLTKQERNRLAGRLHYNRRNKRFYSAVIPTSLGGRNAISNLLPLVTRDCWNDCEDVLKAPHCNKAKPAYFSPAAINQYYGWPLPVTPEEQIGDPEIQKRTAYGVGSGQATIGLDPRYMKVLPPGRNLLQLTSAVTKAIGEANPEWASILQANPFNNASVKIYLSYRNEKGKLVKKCVGMHCDVSHDKITKAPLRNNSQKPGTLVGLLTFGANKNLWFRSHWSRDGYHPNSLLHFLQKSGTLFVLDPRDETPDRNGNHWRHCSTMATEEGITFTYAFRCVQASVLVNRDGTLANPDIGERRRKLFEDGERHFDTDYYRIELANLQDRMEEFLCSYES